MRDGRPSASAQHIALVRAYLTKAGVLDDAYAAAFLRPAWAAMLKAPFLLELSNLIPAHPFSHIAGRTRFYDDLVTRAIDDGVQQAVILAAGYDSRAWRLARDGVRFIEIDHPDTQRHKRARAPAGGPDFVPADLAAEGIDAVLHRAGFRLEEPAVFTCEGLTMYLTEIDVRRLLEGIARSSSAGTTLGADFGIPSRHEDRFRFRVPIALTKAVAARGGEPVRFQLHPDDAPSFLDAAGWGDVDVLTGPQLHGRFLRGTRLPVPRAGAYMVSARVKASVT